MLLPSVSRLAPRRASRLHSRTGVASAMLLMVVMLALGASCRDLPTAPPVTHATAPSLTIPSTAPGTPELVFLAPLDPRSRPHGVLDTTLAPVVTICRLSGSSCGATVARFTSDSTVADSLRVALTGRAYAVRWITGSANGDTAAYRVSVALGDTLIGATDLRLLDATATATDTAEYAYVGARRALEVRFRIFVPAETLTVVLGPGVHGTLADGAVEARHGERIPYRFTADSGYRNLLVTLDDGAAPGAGRVQMNGSHTLIATADLAPTVVPGDEWILREARALLRTPSVNGAQRLLTRLDSMADTVGLADRLRRVEYAALYDADGDALDAALAGNSFRVGEGFGAPPAGPPPPSGGGGTATALLAPAHPLLASPDQLIGPSPTPPPVTAPPGPAEPLTIAFVNGVLTTPFGALFGANHLARVARTVNWNALVPFDVRLVYNRTATGRAPLDRCIIKLSGIVWYLGWNSVIPRLASCARTTLAEAGGYLADFAEAGAQLAAIAGDVSSRPGDADSVSAAVQRWRSTGRHVLLVPHSQGNFMVQQGIDALARSGAYRPSADSTCIGAVSLAAPSSHDWPIPARHLRGLVVEGDAILSLHLNDFPRVHTELDDSADAAVALAARTHSRAAAIVVRLRYAVRLHELVGSYLTREPIRTRVRGALAESYRSCALGTVQVVPRQLQLTVGSVGQLGTQMAALDGLPLDGTRGVRWSAEGGSDWQRGVSVTGSGSVRARYTGATSVRADTRSIGGIGGVTVDPAPLAVGVAEALSGFWSYVPGTTIPPVGAPADASPPSYGSTVAGWGDCGGKTVRSSQGWTVTMARVCVARYRVTVSGMPAVQYDAAFFPSGSHTAAFTMTSAAVPLTGEVSGPLPSMDPLPPPPILDRVTIAARDAAGHLLATGTGCAHGCIGW